jgi:hypothetical protein
LRTRGIRMACKAGALEKVLLLARSILRADLLAIDALHREALVIFCKPVSMSDVRQGAIAERKVSVGSVTFCAKLDKRRMHILIDCTAHGYVT